MATAEHMLTGPSADALDDLGRQSAGDTYRRVQNLVAGFRVLISLSLLGAALIYG